MTLKETVFGSKSEENVFGHLNSIWGDKIKIYHNLPFANIFDMDTIKIKDYSTKNTHFWKKFLFMTSIDFVVCDDKNKAIMCIEFDGLSGGYNKGTEYFQDRTDSKRKKKLELKLKIAKNHNLPFYIISYEETTDLSENLDESDLDFLNLTVVDGIIGQTMKHKLFPDKLEEYLDFYDDSLNSMEEFEKNEFIQDLVIDAEVELELKWDPIAIRASEIQCILSQKGLISRYGHEFIHKPKLPPIKSFYDYKGLKKRIEAMQKVEWQGCKVHCETPDGTIARDIWIRNFEGMGVSPLIIVQNIADLIIFYEIAKKYKIKIPKSSYFNQINEDYSI